jgi:hypothetical protein
MLSFFFPQKILGLNSNMQDGASPFFDNFLQQITKCPVTE